ncbi:MAG: hypothetical protein KGI27_08905 [Thaumarchaeota archaeon]|nr:hypothetical protein [Nitrososphaerota archaeon]
MSETRTKDLQKQMIQFVKENPFCSKDSMFTKGKICKSKKTENIFEQLTADQKIKIIHTENGKPRYYDQSYKNDLNLLRYLFRDLEHKLKEATKRFPGLKPLLERYAIIFRLRMKVLEHEQKVLSTSDPHKNVSLNLDDTVELLQKIQSFMDDPQDAERHIKSIDIDIRRDRYYLEHQLHSKPRLIYHSFQKEKFRHVRRPVYQLLKMMKGDRFGLKKTDYDKNVKKLRSNSDFKYEEIFNRLIAEHNRTLYHNPEMTPNEVMLMVTRDRLREINRKHSLSKNDQYEKIILEDWQDVISKVPMEELLTSPKYEMGIPRHLLSRFSKKKKILKPS